MTPTSIDSFTLKIFYEQAKEHFVIKFPCCWFALKIAIWPIVSDEPLSQTFVLFGLYHTTMYYLNDTHYRINKIRLDNLSAFTKVLSHITQISCTQCGYLGGICPYPILYRFVSIGNFFIKYIFFSSSQQHSNE